ncbi:MAG: cyclic nucleotide-binding domain-containing protein [Nitrospiraceae bacterium]|nr:MAG: cyclic nucleotide-binding domain-containing protein [Nitrospiraceae bacterium]
MAADIKGLIYGLRDELILFQLLSDDEVDRVIPYLEVIDYPKGTTIFNEGDEEDFVGFVTAGVLELKKDTEFEGRQIVIALVRKGSFVGEIALVDEKHTRSATAVALENSEMIIMRRKALDAIVDKYPIIAVKILKGLNQVMAVRMRKAMERLASIF